MKDLGQIFAARPTFKLGILALAIGLFLSPVNTHANDTENELLVESWMLTPFDNAFPESEIHMESWMVTPFGIESSEEELTTETWMSAFWF